MSSLTDLEGICRRRRFQFRHERATLTSADTTAVAGTHTVTVTSLATTSSGYLAEIPDASDTLSGSITLSGTGTAQKISVPTTSGNNTLAGLASAITPPGWVLTQAC